MTATTDTQAARAALDRLTEFHEPCTPDMCDTAAVLALAELGLAATPWRDAVVATNEEAARFEAHVSAGTYPDYSAFDLAAMVERDALAALRARVAAGDDGGAMTGGLVLSLFPGIGLLDRAFEEAGYCVVRGPDVLWGSDVRNFHPPAGVFDGVIGGPPCQTFSTTSAFARFHERTAQFGNLIPEFERVVAEAGPSWFLMENVKDAPLPLVSGYALHSVLFNNRWTGADQNRVRRFSFGTRDGWRMVLEEAALFSPVFAGAVTSAHGGYGRERKRGEIRRYTVDEAATLQGLPTGYLDHAPFTQQGKLKAIANGVPLPMGRAIANAVRRAMQEQEAAG